MPSSGSDPTPIVLDTSAYSQLRLGHEEVLSLLAAAEVVLLPVTVLGELAAGFRLGTRERDNRRALTEFLAEPFVEAIETTERIASRYGALFAELRSVGTPIPVNDIWIAAATFERSGKLLTFDRDFERIERLERIGLSA